MKATVQGLFDVVVIGVDGTERSERALAWVASEVPDGGTVHLVHAVAPVVELAVAAAQADSRSLVAHRCADLAGPWSAEFRRALGGRAITIEHHVVEDTPAHALLHMCEQIHPSAIVVGAHAGEIHRPALLGRTIGQLVELASVPVVIVGSAANEAPPSAPVVVGVGADPRPALEWAADYATARGRGVSLVRAGHEPIFTIDGLLDLLAYYLDPTTLQQWKVDDLLTAAHELQLATEEELDITWQAPHRGAGRQLVEAGSAAAVLVLARPGRAPASSAAVPSWLRRVIAHAACPVVVVPSPAVEHHRG
jgi:nucleotide-binding universal stress UspA family protein